VVAEANDVRKDQETLSVVVAAHNARVSVAECLTALTLQQAGEKVEIIVVDNSIDGTTEIIRDRFPQLKLCPAPPSALIPELWATGIRQSSGSIVAITTAHCVPAKDWLSCIREAHQSPVSAVGGAIENDASAGVIDWAVYFCRYSSYMLPLRESFVAEIAGDNASYKRIYLDRYQHAWRQGFWEPTVHAELRRAGLQLLLAPAVVICHKRSFGLWGFVRQRFQHGMRFGQWRAANLTVAQRTLRVILSPAIPLLLLLRIGRQLLAKGRHLRQFMLSLPVLILFLLSWTAGEVAGYLRGAET
jgi:glycosyltransferase involved in cell wall biosynthesis